jgi:hypothetical protein
MYGSILLPITYFIVIFTFELNFVYKNYYSSKTGNLNGNNEAKLKEETSLKLKAFKGQLTSDCVHPESLRLLLMQ